MRRFFVVPALVVALGVIAASSSQAAPTKPVVSASPSRVNFGKVEVGTWSPNVTITFRNTSTDTSYMWGGVAYDGDFASFDWSVEANTCSTNLAPSATCTIRFQVYPSEKGRFAGTFLASWGLGTTAFSVSGSGVVLR